MTHRLPLLLACLMVLTLVPGVATAADPPPGDISDNVEFIANVSEAPQVISLAFDGDLMFASAVTGVYSYDISDPANPQLLGALPEYIWQNEDMDIDTERKLLFISRDPRGFTGIIAPAQARFFGAVEIIDYSNPSLLRHVNAYTLPAGHTSTCISAEADGGCDFLWTGGPFANEAFGPAARPIYATDVRDPLNPVQCPEPINGGMFDEEDGSLRDGYAHDVNVDDAGVAWVASESGVHGYHTYGEHLDPISGELRTATPCDPVPYGGANSPEEATPSRFMHNSELNPDITVPGDPDSAGHVLFATEEAISSSCATSGRFSTYDVRSTLDGSGFTDVQGARLQHLDTWTPEGADGATGCSSAHYFEDRGDGLLAYSFFGQGIRFLDASDPTDIRQVGYFRANGNNTWAAYWHKDHVFVADNGRGIDVLKFHDEVDADGEIAVSASPTVVAPLLPDAELEALHARQIADEGTNGLCLIPTELQQNQSSPGELLSRGAVLGAS